MARMTAAAAAVLVMEKEGVTNAFGVPGAAINPLYAALRPRNTIGHVLARHVEGASHMAEGFTRAKAGNIGVCIGTSGPAGTDMITGLYSAAADSIPILCITGQAPRARLYKEDFQAVEIAEIAKPVAKWADEHPLMVGMVGLQTAHRYGNATMLKSDFVLGLGNRWANRHTGSIDVYTKGRKFVHVDIEPTQIGRVFNPDLGIVSDAKAALELFVEAASERKAHKALKDRSQWLSECRERKKTMLRRTHFEEAPIKPQRVYEEMNKVFDKDVCYVSTIGLSQIAAAQFLHVYRPRHWINCGQAGPLGWTIPAALGVRAADPDREIVAISGDYDFQFMIEELAVGAQFKLPYIHVVVNNSYLGLIRQSQRGFNMDYSVQLSFENVNAPELGVYGVDHVKVAEGFGCKAIRVTDPERIADALKRAHGLTKEFRTPVIVEIILERVTNIAMGAEIDNITEFEDLAKDASDAPTAIALLD
jgi:tartronate-semialdehyde synthase